MTPMLSVDSESSSVLVAALRVEITYVVSDYTSGHLQRTFALVVEVPTDSYYFIFDWGKLLVPASSTLYQLLVSDVR